MRQFEGKVAVITAAGSGIGRATACTLAARGAAVLVTDIRAENANATVELIVQQGGSASSLVVDVESEIQVRSMIDAAVERYGRVDILHNNAALLDPQLSELDINVLTIPADWWDRVMAVNLRGVMLGCKYAIPQMLKNGGGAIINTSSSYGLNADAFQVAYGTSKAAIVQLTRYVATHFGKQGIRCNAVAPGMVMTPLIEKVIPKEVQAIHLENALTPYLGKAEDIASAVAFLASEEARYITGQCLSVDGGATAHLPSSAPIMNWLKSLPV